jgi:plastocyanin
MPASWSITIVPGAGPGDPVTFNPADLRAKAGDVVHWNNTTPRPHLIWETDTAGAPLSVPLGGTRWASIQPGNQSPAWTVPQRPKGTTIHYRCLRHDSESGTITIR